jgi:hypothetical protein
MTWRQVSMGALMVMKAALQGALLLYGSGVGYDREEWRLLCPRRSRRW